MQLALVDDHILFRKALAACISHWSRYEVTLQAGNGTDLIDIMQRAPTPQLGILDINMPIMNGFETIHWLQQHSP
ncbi:MAG: response regulator, partial [Bacteroidota bacterium]